MQQLPASSLLGTRLQHVCSPVQGAGTQTQALLGGGTPAFAWGQGECRVGREVSQGSNVTCLLSLKGPGDIQEGRRRAHRLRQGDREVGDRDCEAVTRGGQLGQVVRLVFSKHALGLGLT